MNRSSGVSTAGWRALGKASPGWTLPREEGWMEGREEGRVSSFIAHKDPAVESLERKKKKKKNARHLPEC